MAIRICGTSSSSRGTGERPAGAYRQRPRTLLEVTRRDSQQDIVGRSAGALRAVPMSPFGLSGGDSKDVDEPIGAEPAPTEPRRKGSSGGTEDAVAKCPCPPDARIEARRMAGDFVPAFAPEASLRRAFQQANLEAKPIRSRITPPAGAGQSLPSHPIILRDLPPEADARLSQAQLSRLHRSLNQRDLVLLQALYDYRYLNSLQICDLFFPSLRSCQMRLQALRDLGLLYRWPVIETPGVRRRHSLCLISQRGARVLADYHGDDQREYVKRSRDARDHCWHALHDLEANQVFVSLASQSRGSADEGLLLWYGEDHVRAERRQAKAESGGPVPTPDGRGVYLARSGRIYFELEWDRGTEAFGRLEAKVKSYALYFQVADDASLRHILLVLPTDDRERTLRQAGSWDRLCRAGGTCCSFWTTTAWRVRRDGPLAPIWLGTSSEDAADGEVSRQSRTSLGHFAPIADPGRSANDCIGKPRWWERRPGGGQAA